MNTLHHRPRRWGSLTDTLADTYREASTILRRSAREYPIPFTIVLPYVSTETGERRTWRYGPDPGPPARSGRRGVAIPVSDIEPDGAA